jgi:hypothetical protein
MNRKIYQDHLSPQTRRHQVDNFESMDDGDGLPIAAIILFVRKHFIFIFLMGILGAGAGYGAVQIVPKRFKTSATLNIQNSYFQIPLVNDFVSGSNDPSEIQSQKQALLQMALNDEFLESLGQEFKQFHSEPGTAARAGEKEAFSKSVDSFALNSNTFQLGVAAGDPKVSLAMTQKILERVENLLIEERTKKLVQYRDSLQKRLASLGPKPGSQSKGHHAPAADPRLRQIRAMEARLAELSTQFTPDHPTILEMKEQLQVLKSRMKSPNEAGIRGTPAEGEIQESLNNVSEGVDLYNDLTKKLSYLDIVLELEQDRSKVQYLSVIQKPQLQLKPVSPKVRDFVAGGAVAGFALAFLISLISEMRSKSSEGLDGVYVEYSTIEPEEPENEVVQTVVRRGKLPRPYSPEFSIPEAKDYWPDGDDDDHES